MIGIFGGTFDPIHNGHLRIAKDVQQALQLEHVRFIPLSQAVHRDTPNTSCDQRLLLIEAAIKDTPFFIADDRELKREGGSYTIDTLKSLKQDFPGKTLCLLLGKDAFRYFLTWKQPEEILTLAHLIIMQRPGQSMGYSTELNQLITKHESNSAADLNKKTSGVIYFQKVKQLDISSTDIRQRIDLGETITDLVPHLVATLIEEKNIY